MDGMLKASYKLIRSNLGYVPKYYPVIEYWHKDTLICSITSPREFRYKDHALFLARDEIVCIKNDEPSIWFDIPPDFKNSPTW